MAPGVFNIEPFHNILIFWDTEFGVLISCQLKLKEINTWNISVCVEWMYTLYKFHFLNGISEINQLFGDILMIWPAPVYVTDVYIYIYIYINCFWGPSLLLKNCYENVAGNTVDHSMKLSILKSHIHSLTPVKMILHFSKINSMCFSITHIFTMIMVFPGEHYG